MSQIKPTSGPAFVGKTQGNTPNLFWRRLAFDQLRAQSQYIGLPPVEQLHFESTADYRYSVLHTVTCEVLAACSHPAIFAEQVQFSRQSHNCRNVRQESQLWTQLHQGLLTTGKLNAALGFYEPAAAKRLGIPRDRVNHNSLLSAAANLQLPAYGLECLDMPAAPVIQSQPPSHITAAPPGLQNAITVSEYEAAAIKLANASLADTAGRSKRHRSRRPLKQQQQTQQAMGAATAVAETAAAKASPVQAEPNLDPYATADARRKRCTTVATRGECQPVGRLRRLSSSELPHEG